MSDYCEKCGEKIRSKIQMKGDAEQTKCGLCMDDELNARVQTDKAIKTDYEHFYFLRQITEHKKPIWGCFQVKTNTHYGIIDFYLYWDTWVFSPHPLAVLSSPELKDITDFLDQLNSSQNHA